MAYVPIVAARRVCISHPIGQYLLEELKEWQRRMKTDVLFTDVREASLILINGIIDLRVRSEREANEREAPEQEANEREAHE